MSNTATAPTSSSPATPAPCGGVGAMIARQAIVFDQQSVAGYSLFN